jgi:hypothetical protein
MVFGQDYKPNGQDYKPNGQDYKPKRTKLQANEIKEKSIFEDFCPLCIDDRVFS